MGGIANTRIVYRCCHVASLHRQACFPLSWMSFVYRLVEELGYKAEEVATMDPALGMAALNKKIARPWGSQPMPEVRRRSLQPPCGRTRRRTISCRSVHTNMLAVSRMHTHRLTELEAEGVPDQGEVQRQRRRRRWWVGNVGHAAAVHGGARRGDVLHVPAGEHPPCPPPCDRSPSPLGTLPATGC